MLKTLLGINIESAFVMNDRCFLGGTIPGKNIIKSFGLISMVTKGIRGNINDELDALMVSFINTAEQKGGNAITHFRFESGSYQVIRSGLELTYLFLYGELVLTD